MTIVTEEKISQPAVVPFDNWWNIQRGCSARIAPNDDTQNDIHYSWARSSYLACLKHSAKAVCDHCMTDNKPHAGNQAWYHFHAAGVAICSAAKLQSEIQLMESQEWDHHKVPGTAMETEI